MKKDYFRSVLLPLVIIPVGGCWYWGYAGCFITSSILLWKFCFSPMIPL